MSRPRVLLITGFSGSGKSSAAKALEDEGFFVVDNLPLVLLPQFLSLVEESHRIKAGLAVVIDVRNREFLTGLDDALAAVDAAGYDLEILFLEAADPILIRRFSETRRPHPLAPQEGVEEGIERERGLLADLKAQATYLVDTSELTPHQLRRQVIHLMRQQDGASPLVVRLQSFGYRYGLPPESDLVIDVRFLPNPHFVAELKPLTGLDPRVRDYVLAQKPTRLFLRRLKEMFRFLLPWYIQEGKTYLTISFGCTGGRHRSVSICETLRPFFERDQVTVDVRHKDIDKV